jgi:hypothetical protein
MVDFDPDDGNIPQKLRNRFTSWATEPPRLQYSQYGPIDKYLNLKFPGAMVKPQGLIRPIMSVQEVEMVVGMDGLVGEDGLLDVGNTSIISIDSTGMSPWNMCTLLLLNIFAGQYVSKQERKRYPDFVVTSYYDDEEKNDKIRLIVEIGSLHKREEAASQKVKDEIQKQLHDYMTMLGEEGVRWATTVLGIAILGTEVCFSRPRRIKEDGSIMFTKPSKWYDLYDGIFVKEINKVAMMCKQEDN